MNSTLEAIARSRVIAIVRAGRSERLLDAIEAIAEGGVNTIEVTVTTPGALDLIREVSGRYPDLHFGAGTITSAEAAKDSISAGARFIVCPVFRPAIIHECKGAGVPVFPGCLTPSEILDAWEAGADAVKVFPIPGPAYLKALRAPMPQVRMVPTGGVTLENAAEYLRAGAFALGVGSALFRDDSLDSAALGDLRERAKRWGNLAEYGR